MINEVMLCGSKKYENQNFDKLVDYFEIIVRHNSLHDKHGYGKRPASIQVMNSHMMTNFVTKDLSGEELYKIYRDSGRTLEDGIYLKKYLNSVNEKINLRKNYADVLKNIGYSFEKQPMCGTGSVAYFVSKKRVPFLIGYSLKTEFFSKHVTNNYDYRKRNNFHKRSEDVMTIIDMHNRGLIDASFCTIIDAPGKKL